MNVKSCEKLEKSTVALTVEVSAEEFEAAVAKAYQKMRKKINIPGFRPGKAPRKIIEGMYGAEVFYEEAVNIAMPEAYEAAVKEQNLDIVGYPSVELEGEITKDGFTFKAVVPVYPEVTLGTYKGLKAPKDTVKVAAADVDARIDQLVKRNTRLVSVDRAVENGDTAVIDYEGFLDGKPFDGGKDENHNLEIGSGSFVPGFEEQLIGMKAGEEKDIDITFPENYHADLAGKAVVFHVKVNEVKVKEEPALDDEFAKDVSEFDTLKDLKADIKKKITEEREAAAQSAFEEELINQVADGMTCDVPDAMVDAQIENGMQNFKMQVQQQGIAYEDYLKLTGLDEKKLRDDAREGALRRVRQELALAAIIKAENLEVSDEDIEAEFKTLAEQYGMELDTVKKYLPVDQVKDQLLTRKAVAVVVDNATVAKKTTKKATAEDGEEKKAEGEEKKPAKKTTKKAAAEAEGEEKKSAKKTTKKAEKAE